MAKSLSTNYVDTAIPSGTTRSLERGNVYFGVDFKVKSDEPNEAVLTNITSPIGQPEKFRFGFSEIADVYKGTGVEPGLYAPTRRGTSILCQLTEVWTVTDTVDATYKVDLPVSAHLVIKVPNNENVTPAMIQTFVGRLLSGLYETNSDTTDRMLGLLRGSLLPSDV